MLRKGHERPKGYIMACPHPIMVAWTGWDESFCARRRRTQRRVPQEWKARRKQPSSFILIKKNKIPPYI